jgi:hypothetical protein
MKREVMSGALMGAFALALMTGCVTSTCKECPFSQNASAKSIYYKDGKFDAAKAKLAYFAMMKRFNVPVFEAFEKDEGYFWPLDFHKGDFESYGMAGVFYSNVKFTGNYGYLGHDIFLLPNQSIPEHRHLVTKDEKGVIIPAKEESWIVRHGTVYGFSEIGEPNLDKFPEVKAKLSRVQIPYLKSLHVEKWVADGRAHVMPKAESWHFMMAGPDGAVVSEFATYHDMAGLRFSVPGAHP